MPTGSCCFRVENRLTWRRVLGVYSRSWGCCQEVRVRVLVAWDASTLRSTPVCACRVTSCAAFDSTVLKRIHRAAASPPASSLLPIRLPPPSGHSRQERGKRNGGSKPNDEGGRGASCADWPIESGAEVMQSPLHPSPHAYKSLQLRSLASNSPDNNTDLQLWLLRPRPMLPPRTSSPPQGPRTTTPRSTTIAALCTSTPDSTRLSSSLVYALTKLFKGSGWTRA